MRYLLCLLGIHKYTKVVSSYKHVGKGTAYVEGKMCNCNKVRW